ncbi:MAG: hypothetical protein ABIO19_14695, partial [Burkholderiaceae bacterium]
IQLGFHFLDQFFTVMHFFLLKRFHANDHSPIFGTKPLPVAITKCMHKQIPTMTYQCNLPHPADILLIRISHRRIRTDSAVKYKIH